MLKRRLLIPNSGGGSTKLSPPQFSPTPGYSQGNNIRVTITNPNAFGSSTIKYTTDGTIPSETNGTTYTARISVSPPGATINAVCIPSSSGYIISDVNCGEYLVSSKSVVAPKITPNSGTYTSSITVEMVDLNDPTAYASIYYSIGEYSDPINNGTLYTAPFTLSTNGDYHIKAIALAYSTIISNTVTEVDYTIALEEPDIPQPFKDSSLIVRMYLNNDAPSQILSSSFDYTNWSNKGIRVYISDGTSGEIIEYNNFTRIDSSNWTGTYTVPIDGYYFVRVVLPGSEIPSLLFKGTNVTDIEYIAPEITKIGSTISGTTSYSECSINLAQTDPYGAFRESALRTILLDRVTHTTYTDLKSGENLQAIGAASFKHCTSVIEVEFPKDIRFICGCAFYAMNLYEDTLREIYLPTSLQYIGYGAFSGCYYVQDYHLGDCKSLLEIFSQAFSANQSLATIIIPSTVTSIGSGAFSDMQLGVNIYDCCRLVEVINLSATLELAPADNHISGIGKYCLRYSTRVRTSSLSPAILIEGPKYLSFKPSGSSVTVNYLVHFIPTYNSQQTINLPESDRTIESYVVNTAAFTKTSANQNIPTSFTKLAIPSAATELKDYAFIGGWGELDAIFLLDGTTAPTISSNTFRDFRNNGTLMYWWEITGTAAWMSNNPYYLGYKDWSAISFGP